MFQIGGNSLQTAPPGDVHDFVQSHGGHTVITKVSLCTLYASGRVSNAYIYPGPHRQQRCVLLFSPCLRVYLASLHAHALASCAINANARSSPLSHLSIISTILNMY